MSTNRVAIDWESSGGKKVLKFSFIGNLDEAEAKNAITRWKDEFSKNLGVDEKAIIIYNCIEMIGYETVARQLWQKAMGELKPNIATIWIVSTDRLIIMAAKTMAVLTNYNIKIAKSESEIRFA